MTLLDTNLLVYAAVEGAPEHQPTRGWLEQRLLEGDGTLVLCWPVVYAFVRLIANARIRGTDAVTVREGWAIAASYLNQPAIRLIMPGPRHAEIAAELASTPGLRADDVPDIEIAALAIEHGLVLASHDHGFRRFSRLRVIDPLTGEGP